MNRIIAWMLLISFIGTACVSPAATQRAEITPPGVTASATQTESTILTSFPTLTAIPSQSLLPTLLVIATPTTVAIPIEDIVEYEMRSAFNFFWEQANSDITSPGFGLIRDRYPGSDGIASIASVGFGLTAYLIGIEKGYISYQEGLDRVNGTLDTLLKLDRTEGFFYHFLDLHTGKRAWESEVSSIDTTILIMGVISAGQYFGGEIESKAKKLYDDVNWPWFIDPSRNMFYMAYRPEKGFEGHWDFYAEQLMLYVLASGSDTHPVDNTAYYTFTRHYAKYGNGKPFIHSWFGSIFTYQFSHAWIDFRDYIDKEGVNWFDNSVEASQSQVNFAMDMQDQYKTLGPYAWGLTACDGPDGYNGTYGAPPSGFDNNSNYVDDTIPPSGAIGSIIFVPDQSLQAMMNYYSIDKLKGPYGFVDAYNLSKNWFDSDVIGIDKGISLLMLANYQDEAVHNIMMKNKNILQGLDILEFAKIN